MIFRISFSRVLAAFCALAFASAPSVAQDAAAPTVQELPEYGLSITLPSELTAVVPGKPDDQIKAKWRAQLHGASLDILLFVLPNKEFGFDEPEDVSEVALESFRDPHSGDATFSYEKTVLVPGPFGFAPYGAIGYGPIHGIGTELVGTYFVLGGLLAESGYALEVRAKPVLAEADIEIIVDFLEKGIVYKGVQRIAKWTDDEAKKRWAEDAPDKAQKKLKKLVRTDHYIVMTDSDAGDKFGKAMEECYAAIKKIYPFEDVAGRKLMPVFLFISSDEYYAFLVKTLKMTQAQAEQTKGISTVDFYATYFEALNDPVHIHEATHQIFRNRLRLPGGGSWFQEGVAEYVSTKPNDRNVAASAVKKGKQVRLDELIKMKSLIFSAKKDVKSDDAAGNMYAEAALLIEFLRESKWGKDKFQSFIHAVGEVPRNNVQAIARAVHDVYGVELKQLEDQWTEYCKKR